MLNVYWYLIKLEQKRNLKVTIICIKQFVFMSNVRNLIKVRFTIEFSNDIIIVIVTCCNLITLLIVVLLYNYNKLK